MKKQVFQIVLMVFWGSATANVDVGMKIGGNLGLIVSPATTAQNFDPGFSAGVYSKIGKIFSADILYNRYGCSESRTYQSDILNNTFVGGYYKTRFHILSIPIYASLPIKCQESKTFELGYTNNILLRDQRIKEFDYPGPWGAIFSEGKFGSYYPDLFMGYGRRFDKEGKFGVLVEGRFNFGLNISKSRQNITRVTSMTVSVGIHKKMSANKKS